MLIKRGVICFLCTTVVLLASLSYNPLHLAAQTLKITDHHFIHYDNSNSDLTTNKVYRVLSHDNGYLYCCTDLGLLRFNGSQFKTIIPTDGIDLVNWYLDSNDTLWLFDFSGNIYIYDIVRNKATKLTITNFSLSSIKRPLPRPFLFSYEDATHIYFHKKHERELLIWNKNSRAYNLYDSAYGSWLTHQLMLEVKHKIASKDEKLAHDAVQVSTNDCIIAVNEVYRRKNFINEYMLSLSRLGNTNKMTHAMFSDDYLYFNLLNEGLFRMSLNRENFIDTLFSREGTSSFSIDGKNELWISSLFDGLYYQNFFIKGLHCIAFSEVENDNMAISSLASINGKILIYSTYNKDVIELSLMDNNQWKLSNTYLKTGKILKTIPSAHTDYLATYENIFTFDNAKQFTPIIPDFKYMNVKDAQYDDSTSSFYIGNNNHLFRYESNGKAENVFTFRRKNMQCFSILPNGSFLIGSSLGLYIDSLPVKGWEKENVRKIIKHHHGHYIITNSGVTYMAFDKSNNITHRHMVSPLIATNGFVSGSRLYLFNNEHIVAHSASSHKYIKSISNAQWPNKVSINALLQYQSHLMIGTSRGLFYIDTNYFDIPSLPIKAYVYNPSGMLDSGKYIMSYNQYKQLNIQLDIINYHHEPLTVSYAVDKDDKPYISERPLDNNMVSLSNLDPGTYFLQFVVTHKLSRAQLVKAYTIVVTPLWYQTMLFKVLAGFMFVLITLGIVLFFVNQAKSKLVRASLQRQQITDLELKSRLNQLKPHFLFNIINPIQYYLLQGDKQEGIAYVQKFSSLMRNSLDIFRKNAITIAQELTFVEDYLHLQKKRFDDKFDYTITVDDAIQVDATYIPSMVLQPIIENSIEHGFKHIAHQGKLVILLEKNGDCVKVTIRDNGPGIPKEFEWKENHALSILKEKTALLKSVHPKADLYFHNLEQGFETILVLPILSNEINKSNHAST